MVLPFKSVDETLVRDHLNETVLSCSTMTLTVVYSDSNFYVCTLDHVSDVTIQMKACLVELTRSDVRVSLLFSKVVLT